MKIALTNSSNYGKLTFMLGLFMLVPLSTLIFYPEDIPFASDFIIPGAFSIILGILICLFKKSSHSENQYTMQNSSLTVLFIWLYSFLIGAMPFVLSGQLTFLQALFEAVSGWTTTGLSVMDVSKTPHIFLFHRSFMQFCGGLGFIIMMLMFIQGKEAMSLYNAEGHPDKLMPNLRKTAQTIFTMHFTFLILGTMTYILFGMTPFDSLTHTMCALSTGGFSTQLNSIGEYHSLSIDLITIVLMLVGTTNFAVLLLVAKGKWRQVLGVSEIKFLLAILGITIPLLALALYKGLNLGAGESLQTAVFDSISALSTTGYSSMSYTSWPPFAIGLMILLMLIGGGIGSTAGGMKLTRAYLLCRVLLLNLRKRLAPPRRVFAPYYIKAQGKTPIDEHLILDTIGFTTCYIFIFITGSLGLTLSANCSLSEAMFEFASALGTVGLSIGLTGPSTNNLTLIIEMFGMLLGRLEIFIILMGVYSSFILIKNKWKIYQKESMAK